MFVCPTNYRLGDCVGAATTVMENAVVGIAAGL